MIYMIYDSHGCGARKLRPSEALYACGALGVALRCRRSDAAEVEPWRLGEIAVI